MTSTMMAPQSPEHDDRDHRDDERHVPVAHDEVFQDLVNRELRGDLSDHEAEQLYQPDNLMRWRLLLLRMKREVENQIANVNTRITQSRRDYADNEGEWLAAHARLAENRVRKIKFLTAIERSLLTIRELHNVAGAESAQVLRAAIAAHRDALDELDIELSDPDIALHRVLS